MTAPDELTAEATARARLVGLSPATMALAIRAERRDRPFVVEWESKPGGPFYRPAVEGPSRILYINTAHPFYPDCYMAPGTTRHHRDALEVFLWVLGTSELAADPDDRTRYQQERHRWSERLRQALPILASIMDFEGAREAERWGEDDEL